MHARALQLLKLLVEEPDALSRNRHFALFEDPIAADVRRRAAYLRQIRESLLEEADILTVTRDEETLDLSLRHASGLMQRARIRLEEADILRVALGDAAPAALVECLRDRRVPT